MWDFKVDQCEISVQHKFMVKLLESKSPCLSIYFYNIGDKKTCKRVFVDFFLSFFKAPPSQLQLFVFSFFFLYIFHAQNKGFA